MSHVYGNIKVNYTPCRSVGQLKNAAAYMLGRQKSQIKQGIIKTYPDLYNAIGCNKDNFSNSILITRKMHAKSYKATKKNEILAHKMSISFHPDDNHTLDYNTAYNIGHEFAQEFFGNKDYEVLFAVHTDTEHIHVHYLISNCNIRTGKSFRRGPKDLMKMSEFFGWQCMCNNLKNSIRKDYYNKTTPRNSLTLPEIQMHRKGQETFKDELREVIQLELSNPENKSFESVVAALTNNYGIEIRIKGNTVSYRHPEYRDKNGNLISVRASKLGNLYTRKGINNELNKQKQWTNCTPGERTSKRPFNSRSNYSSTSTDGADISQTNIQSLSDNLRAYTSESASSRTSATGVRLPEALPGIREDNRNKNNAAQFRNRRDTNIERDTPKLNKGRNKHHGR